MGIIYWRSEITQGNGEPISLESAKAWVKHLQKSNDGIKYWIKEVN